MSLLALHPHGADDRKTVMLRGKSVRISLARRCPYAAHRLERNSLACLERIGKERTCSKKGESKL